MREINDHKINPANDTLKIEVMDEPGSGGANHRYQISGFNVGSNPSEDEKMPVNYVTILFQNGPIGEVGVNGVTQEALLAIVADRLRCFNKGPFASRENALALTKVEEAMHWLQQRTLERMRRGVEGTHQK